CFLFLPAYCLLLYLYLDIITILPCLQALQGQIEHRPQPQSNFHRKQRLPAPDRSASQVPAGDWSENFSGRGRKPARRGEVKGERGPEPPAPGSSSGKARREGGCAEVKRAALCVAFLVVAAVSAWASGPGAAGADSPAFTDTGQHWARQDIERLAGMGYIKGYSDGTFRPEQPVTRAEFTALLVSCLGANPSDRTKTYFGDVRTTHWALAQINEAVKRGILIPGEYPTGLVPDGPIMRSETAAMIVRALGKEPDNTPLPFKDQNKLARSMYRGYIKTAYNEGLITGYSDGEFKPFAHVTRAQACTMLVRFLEKRGAPPAVTPVPGSPAGGLTSLVVDGKSFDIRTTPVVFKSGLSEIRVNRIDAAGVFVIVNNSYRFALNSATGNPDVVVDNACYAVRSLSVSGSSLVVVPAARKIYKITVDGYKYSADYVKLYIGDRYGSQYLSDADLTGEYTVEIDGKEYDLSEDKITISVEGCFYRVTRFVFSERDTRPVLVETDPVVIERPGLSDIAAIFVGTRTLDLSRIGRLEFIVDGEIRGLSQVMLDASGSFVVDEKAYPAGGVTLIADGVYYEITSALMYKGKFVFYCTESDVEAWAVVDGKCRPAEDVRILKDGVSYSLDSVLVVKRNLIRIGGRQYEVDSSIKCRVGGKVYDIKKIDFDAARNMVTLETGEATGSYGAQPGKYVFYLGGAVLQDGVNDGDRIYAGGGWRKFGDIILADPARFSYGGSTYDLIGARVRLDGEEYTVFETAWRGRTETLEVYLEGPQ
ncbi:MAG: S-layer homology domain-containing protein, partial [Bacillota bacterium]|nr:S-layer homology domain-containing protein [Bacillota bacterium]